MELKEYAKKVQEMRAAQNGFFRTPATDYLARKAYLDQSKALEREVDRLTQEILNPVPENQLNLF